MTMLLDTPFAVYAAKQYERAVLVKSASRIDHENLKHTLRGA